MKINDYDGDLTFARLREILNYDPETGLFTWLIDPANHIKRGMIAGKTKPRGERLIVIERRDYQASRLAFLWMTGRWPANEMDHVNNIPGDNRWINLREANRSQQTANTFVRTSKKLKLKCVEKEISKYRVRIQVGDQRLHVGRYNTPEEADAAYRAAAKRYGVEINPRQQPHKERPKYRARILVGDRRLNLGRFETPEEAHAAYLSAAKKYYGEYANGG